MLPGVFNLIVVALVPLTASVVNGKQGPAMPAQPAHVSTPPAPAHAPTPPAPAHAPTPPAPAPGHPKREWVPGPECGLPGQPCFPVGPGGGPGGGGGGHGGGHGGHRKRNWQPMEVTRSFQTCKSQVTNHGPSFETACQKNQPQVLIDGLVSLRATILSLSVQVQASVGAWAHTEVQTCAGDYVSLMAQIQVLLQIIHTHNRVDSCKDAILGLKVPLQAFVSVFANAGINVGALLDARVNLSLLASIGISLDLSVKAQL